MRPSVKSHVFDCNCTLLFLYVQTYQCFGNSNGGMKNHLLYSRHSFWVWVKYLTEGKKKIYLVARLSQDKLKDFLNLRYTGLFQICLDSINSLVLRSVSPLK